MNTAIARYIATGAILTFVVVAGLVECGGWTAATTSGVGFTSTTVRTRSATGRRFASCRSVVRAAGSVVGAWLAVVALVNCGAS